MQHSDNGKSGAQFLERADGLLCTSRRDDLEEALVLLTGLSRDDPSNAGVHARLAQAYQQRLEQGWSENRPSDKKNATSHATIAVRLDRASALALSVLGHIMVACEADCAAAFLYLDRARDIAPFEPVAWVNSSLASSLCGRIDQAKRYANEALRLSQTPVQISQAHIARGLVHYLNLDFGDAQADATVHMDAAEDDMRRLVLETVASVALVDLYRAKATAGLIKEEWSAA